MNSKNDSPRPFAVLRTAFPPQLRGYRAQNQVALRAKLMVYFRGIGSKKIITIRSQTPPIACKSERGPALQGQEFDSIESDKVRVSLLVDEELAPRAIPERIYARKPCASAYERPPARSLSVRQAFSSCRRREQEPSTKKSRPSPESRRSKRLRAVSARTRRRPRPRKS